MPSSDTGKNRTASASVLEELRALEARVRDRIKELEPLEEELTELRTTAQRLGIDVSSNAERTTSQPETRTKKPAAKSGKLRAGQSRGRGSRAEDVIKAVGKHPGQSIKQVAEGLGVQPSALYSTVRKLESAGRLRKDGRVLHPVDATA